MKNIAILLAGGNGRRMGSETPKQFHPLAGHTVLEHTVFTFQANPHIHEIAIVVDPAWHDFTGDLIRKNHFNKVSQLLPNGAERYHSTLSALQAYEHTDCNLLIHDAVRPLVSQQIINEVTAALQHYQVVDVAIPATDTIIEVDDTHTYITRIPPRSLLYQVQTPQGFYRPVLAKAFRLALADPDFVTTDDCSVVKKYLPQEKIKLVKGSPSNIKITWPEDLVYAEKILSARDLSLL